MIKLDRSIIRGIRAAKKGPDLFVYLQDAVKLEHSTIPPYLTALFSLRQGTNQDIADQIRSIVMQEMLHMSIASNILIAIGGHPEINTKAFIPDYPGQLPMGVAGGLVVGIEAFSIPLVEKVFMAIEEPEHPVPVDPPSTLALGSEEDPEYATIGQFYDAIEKKILELGPDIFVQKTAPPQVIAPKWFGPDKLFLITDPASACRAIEIIKIEGEGTSTEPFQRPGDAAHYYKFGEIAYGRRVVKTPAGFAYDGPPVLFDPAGVWPLKPNCRIQDFKPGTQARTRIESFAYSYSSLLNALYDTFNGEPAKLNTAIGLMFDLRVQAVALMQTDTGDGSGLTVGPSFEYVSAQGGMF